MSIQHIKLYCVQLFKIGVLMFYDSKFRLYETQSCMFAIKVKSLG